MERGERKVEKGERREERGERREERGERREERGEKRERAWRKEGLGCVSHGPCCSGIAAPKGNWPKCTEKNIGTSTTSLLNY